MLEVDEELNSSAEEIENLIIVDKLVDSFVDIAYKVMRPREAPETTKEEDEYNLLFRKYTKLSDKNTILTRADHNRLEVVKELEKLRIEATTNGEDLQSTRRTNQGLEEMLKVRDTEVKAMEEVINNLKEKAKVDAATAIDQAKNIRSLEEELGVWDDDKEEEEVTELNNEWISDEVQRQNETNLK